jgi:hypothetical protein
MFEIGSSLREARLRQALDFPEVEQATKIRGKYLRALEDEQFDVLPAQTYVKGFLRNYAEYLGLDGQLYVDEFNSRYVVGEDDHAPVRARRSPPARAPRVQSRIVLLTVVGIAAVALIVIIAWTRGGPSKTSIPGLGTQRTLTQATEKKTSTRRLAAVRLSVTAVRGSCWLQVHTGSVAGPIDFQGTLDQGQKQRFAAGRLWITMDRPENVRIVLNGHVRRLPVGGPKTLIVTAHGILPGA